MDGDESLTQLASMGLPRTRSGAKEPQTKKQAVNFRFTKDTDEYRLLEKILKSGTVKASDRPSDIHARYECFQKISVNSFRQQFNKLKNIMGLGTRAGELIDRKRLVYFSSIFNT